MPQRAAASPDTTATMKRFVALLCYVVAAESGSIRCRIVTLMSDDIRAPYDRAAYKFIHSDPKPTAHATLCADGFGTFCMRLYD